MAAAYCGDTAEIFSFTFLYTDALSSVYEISMDQTPYIKLLPVTFALHTHRDEA